MSGLTRRDVFRAGFSAAAIGATASWLSPSSASAAAGDVFLPYSADSFFKSRALGLPVNAARTAAFKSFMKAHPDQAGTPFPKINGIGSNAWGTAFALGVAGDPIWKLVGPGNLPTVCADLRTVGFRAPSWFGSNFSGTNDSPFVLCDTVTGQSIWAANAKKGVGNTITFSAAGRFMHNSNGVDHRNPRAIGGAKNERSRGAIPDAMVIRRDAVNAAMTRGTGLGHVLHMFLVETNGAEGYCHPMVGCESRHSGFGAEGERVAIRSDINLATRNLSPFGLVVARTLQENGAYFGDNSGSTTALKAEQTSATRNPWAGLTVSQDALKGKITWDDFVMINRGVQ